MFVKKTAYFCREIKSKPNMPSMRNVKNVAGQSNGVKLEKPPEKIEVCSTPLVTSILWRANRATTLTIN